ncbi:MAG: outer membrane protein assembly factor BamA [Cyclobacteriaceae bacterium]|nr:outer membrane protein assembly factor BamA [Cyclobacteriaceae bacterium]
MIRILTILILVFSCGYAFAQVGLRKTTQDKGQPDGDIQLDYRNPKIFEIADIAVTGAEFHDSNAIISIAGLKVGDNIKIPGDDITGAIEKIWDLGIIGDITIYVNKVEDEKVWLTIDLKERPRLTRISFDGVSKAQQSELNDQIKLIRGKVLTDVTIKNTELSIKKYFVEKGFLNTKVNIIQREDSLVANGMEIIVQVDKKQKVKIGELIFHGNEQFDDDKLGNKMKKTNEHLRFYLFRDIAGMVRNTNGKKLKNFLFKTKETSLKDIETYLSENIKLNFFRASKFIREEYENDQKSLITFYNGRGYRDARILGDTIYNVSPNKINVEITMEEGIRYYFRDINWVGNFIYDENILNRVLGVQKGDIYDMELINKKLTFNPNGTDISALYMDNGYLAYTCVPVETEIDGDSIDVEMRINEGRQFDINKVIVTGNDRTSDHVIYREIRTLPGQKFSRADLIRTQRELSQLGYFDPEQIGINPMPNFQNGTVDIEYSLVERPSDQIELSGGWGGYYGFVGTLGLVFNNFSLKNITNFEKWRPLPVGDGQRLQLRVQANGQAFQSYSFSFTEPWLGGRKPNAFTVSLQHSAQRTNIFGSSEFQGWLKLSGISLSLMRRIRWPDDYFTLSNSLSYFIYDLNNYGFRLGFSTGVANNFTFNTTIARNSVDAPMYPRYGSSISLSVSLTPPYSLWNDIDYETADNATKYKWVEYHKWMFDAAFYQKLAGNLVASTRVHFGYIGNYGVPVGPFERFIMGGSGLAGNMNFLLGTDIIALRGYEDQEVTPVDRSGIQGGIVYNKFVFELRYPISLNPSATIYVLGFGEAGGNWNDYAEFNPYKLYRAAGLGARIFMPAFGLLGIDWAYGFDRLPGQRDVSGSQFHFTIGQQFR